MRTEATEPRNHTTWRHAMTVNCAVCDLEMETEDAAGSVLVDEERVYFCTDECMQEFHEDPDPYVYEEEDEPI